MRARFVATEVGIGLRRNLTLTVAAIVTTAVSLALLGAGLLLRQQAQRINDLYYGKLEVAIFLRADVSQQQLDALGAQIAADPTIRDFHRETQEEAYTKFKQQFRDSPDFVSIARPQDLPQSFRVQLKDPRQYSVIQARYGGQPGVHQVLDFSQVLGRLFRLLDGLRTFAFSIAVVQVLAAALLIYNTVRVSAFGRRRETGIMRLVGASSFSIQLPFLVEGAVAGLLGGLVACGSLALGKWLLVDGVLSRNISGNVLPPLTWADFTGTMPVIVVIGVLLSSVASFLTLRRFVRV